MYEIRLFNSLIVINMIGFMREISYKILKKVLLIDKRNHIWWNCYDYGETCGITIHKYWPYVFHTKYEDVWEYLFQFTEWKPFFYKVKAIIDSKEVSLPFNLNPIYQVFPQEFAKKLEWLLKTIEYFKLTF